MKAVDKVFVLGLVGFEAGDVSRAVHWGETPDA